MDSLTQAALGAGIGAVCAPKGQRRTALLAGALLGTVPDLDVVIDYGDPVANFTRHRAFSHSLIVLFPASLLIWLAAKRWWRPAREAPRAWLLAISLILVTHPLLDAHTAYGTQLFWPLPASPVMWSTLFIIDPLYTLPILTGVVAAAIRPSGRFNTRLLQLGLVLSTAYIGWSWVAKSIVNHTAQDMVAKLGLQDARIFSTPTPFNTLLWRIVVLTDDGYVEAFDSLLVDENGPRYRRFDGGRQWLDDADHVAAVARLRWFSHDFLKTEVRDDSLVVSDLRMGQEPYYVFAFRVATSGNPHWQATRIEAIPLAYTDRALAETWRRIWQE